jgi:predicted ester cyclase
MEQLTRNKEVVRRFNKEVIEKGSLDAFTELMDSNFINNTAPSGMNDANGMWNTLNNILRPAFSDLTVEIHDQIAEGDKVTTRKTITGTHTGTLMGIAPTNKLIRIEVIDIVKLRNGKYLEHWGLNTLQTVVADLKKPLDNP